MGPKAGRLGGEVVFEGTPKEMLRVDTLTSSYLNGNTEIAVPAERRKGNGQFITIKGASGNNLKHVDVSFPLGTLICVTGVSGSGKSTLINRTLQPILSQHFYHSLEDPLAYDVINLRSVVPPGATRLPIRGYSRISGICSWNFRNRR